MIDIPLGLGMALAQNSDAMKYFASQPQENQLEIIAQTHRINSKREMHRFVQLLAEKEKNQ